jgi:1,4-dihydroxy-2-naphthoate octaprenyltransferase
LKGAILLLRLARPHFLVGAALIYALGAGVARFLGVSIDWGAYLLGQAWVTLIQLSTHFLNEYFDAFADLDNPNRTPFSGGSGSLRNSTQEDKVGLGRDVPLWLAITCLAVAASLTVLLIHTIRPNGVTVAVMVFIFLGAFFYSTPPVRLVSSGYGELTTSFLVANLVPALAFLIQYGEFHRLLAMATFPLTPLHLSMMIAFELPDYASDLKFQKLTLLVRMGWQRGMILHNLMILMSFLILGLAALFGLPVSVALPAFLSLPLGIFQIWMMNRIASGARPNWPALTFTAAALLGVTSYLLMFAFWTR